MDSEVYKWLSVSLNTNVIFTRLDVQQMRITLILVLFFTQLTSDPITPAFRNNLIEISDFLYNRIMDGYEPTNPFSQYPVFI